MQTRGQHNYEALHWHLQYKSGKPLDRVLTLWDDPAAGAECSGKEKDTSSWSRPGWQSRLDCHHHDCYLEHHNHHRQKKLKEHIRQIKY